MYIKSISAVAHKLLFFSSCIFIFGVREDGLFNEMLSKNDQLHLKSHLSFFLRWNDIPSCLNTQTSPLKIKLKRCVLLIKQQPYSGRLGYLTVLCFPLYCLYKKKL